MNDFLPWVALALAVVTGIIALLSDRGFDHKAGLRAFGLTVAGGLVVGALLVVFARVPVGLDLTILLAGFASYVATGSGRAAAAAQIALAGGIVAVGMKQGFTLSPGFGFAALLVALAGGVACGVTSSARGIPLAASGLALGLAAGLAGMAAAPAVHTSWIPVVVLGAVVGLAVAFIKAPLKALGYFNVAASLLFASVGMSLLGLGGASAPLSLSFAAGGAGALVTLWLMGRDSKGLAGLSLLLWLGVGGFAFSQGAGYGVALACFAGIVVWMICERGDLIAFAAPALVIAGFRLFREQNPDITRAFEIGQHYGLMGVVVGALLVITMADLIGRRQGGAGFKSDLGYLLLGLGFLVVVVTTALYLGAKGAVGIAAGLCLAPGLLALVRPASSAVLLGGAGLATLFLSYPVLSESFEVDRSTKLTALASLLLVFLVCLVASHFLLPVKQQENETV